MKTIKEMREEIKDKYYSIPEMQVSPGIYIKTIGHKYVTLIDTWGITTIEKIPIDKFYEEFNRD